MLKKLRVKFVAIIMSMIAVVLVVVFAAICVINYQQGITRVYEALDGSLASIAHGSNSTTPNSTTAENVPSGTSDGTPWGSSAPDNMQPPGSSIPPEIGGKRGGSDPFVPVAVYEVGDDGSLSAAAAAKTTASLADDVLTEAASQLEDRPDGSGSLDALGLYYAKRQIDGMTYLAFADMSTANSWQSLALTLAAVGGLALVVLFVISVLFSRWALRPVERAWTQQRRFVADASHELKTPLTVILANASILLEHPERSIASQSQWVESTQTEAERMQQLVGDLLLLARLDEGTPAMDDDTSCVDLTNLVESEVLQFESVAFERKVNLTSKIAEGVSLPGEASRLRRVATTLIDNACKYADAGGQVQVTLTQNSNRITFSVHNTGAAISPDDLAHVFDRFYRADKARTRDVGGYGLGLAIARAVTEEHGGTLTVTSSDADGTTFTATLTTAN